MDILKESIEFLKPLHLNEDNISELYTKMQNAKQKINDKFGLNIHNDYRKIINYKLTDADFKIIYPNTFRYIKELANGAEFNVCDNWIIQKKNKCKLSKFISKHNYKDSFMELRGGDLSVVFDIIKPKNLVISTNMYDFFTSSSNSSFRSCYAIDGSHFNGNIAYMTDDFTFIIYTASKNLNRKIGRTWGYLINDNTFLTSRIYGSMFDMELALVVDTISKMLVAEEAWKSVEYDYEQFENARPYGDFPIPVYFDYQYTILHTTNQYFNPTMLPTLRFNLINCLSCGTRTNGGYYGMCESCQEDIYKCEQCGGIYHHTDASEVSNLCVSCYDKYYTKCMNCGTVHNKDNIITFEGKELCEICLTKTHSRCRNCGNLCENKYIEKVGEHKICKNCIDHVSVCNGCNSIINNIISATYNGKNYCNYCYDNLRQLRPADNSYIWYYNSINIATIVNEFLVIKSVESEFSIPLIDVINEVGEFTELENIAEYIRNKFISLRYGNDYDDLNIYNSIPTINTSSVLNF